MATRYDTVIKHVFAKKIKEHPQSPVPFSRLDIEKALEETGQTVRNIGDLLYSYRFRKNLHDILPKSLQAKAGKDHFWIISFVGAGKYVFRATKTPYIFPTEGLTRADFPDKTPEVILKHGQKDEQALLTRIRYSGVLNEFLSLDCHSLQNHYRTHIASIGQTETDELYIGIDKQKRNVIIPVQAKGGKDRISIVQIEQDIEVCKAKYPDLLVRPVAIYFKDKDNFSLFEFGHNKTGDVILKRELAYHFTR